MRTDPPIVKWCSWLWWPADRSWKQRLEDVHWGAVESQAARDRRRFGAWRVAVTSGAVPLWKPKQREKRHHFTAAELNGHTHRQPVALPEEVRR
jgi:hypothetical protein